jgi:pimeloyl-ACP methyl ester carboxylesterase
VGLDGDLDPDRVVTGGRVALAVAAVVLSGASAAAVADAGRIEGPFGRSAAQVWIVVPKGRTRSIVVFGHGWKLSPPVPSLAWVDQFRPWLDHLASRGSAVVFPRYQVGANDSRGSARVLAYRRGLSAAFAHLRRPRVPVVVAGYSYGASLAFYYAANASRWGLPSPVAVDSVFPAGLIPGLPLPPLAPTVRVLIQVGDQDTEAGPAGASAFWAWLQGHPRDRKRYEVVASTSELAITHAAPKETRPAARRAFWQPLDALIAAARRTQR